MMAWRCPAERVEAPNRTVGSLFPALVYLSPTNRHQVNRIQRVGSCRAMRSRFAPRPPCAVVLLQLFSAKGSLPRRFVTKLLIMRRGIRDVADIKRRRPRHTEVLIPNRPDFACLKREETAWAACDMSPTGLLSCPTLLAARCSLLKHMLRFMHGVKPLRGRFERPHSRVPVYRPALPRRGLGSTSVEKTASGGHGFNVAV